MKENGRDSSCGERRKSIVRLLPFSIESKHSHFTLNLVVFSRSKKETLGSQLSFRVLLGLQKQGHTNQNKQSKGNRDSRSIPCVLLHEQEGHEKVADYSNECA